MQGLAGRQVLLAGLGLLAIPGLGPVVAAGWLAATAVGAAAGAATGGIIGALPRQAFRTKMRTLMRKVSGGAERSFQPGCRTRIARALTQS